MEGNPFKCKSCGRSVRTTDSGDDEYEEERPNKRKRKNKEEPDSAAATNVVPFIFAGIGGSIAFLIIGVLVGGWLFSRGVASTPPPQNNVAQNPVPTPQGKETSVEKPTPPPPQSAPTPVKPPPPLSPPPVPEAKPHAPTIPVVPPSVPSPNPNPNPPRVPFQPPPPQPSFKPPQAGGVIRHATQPGWKMKVDPAAILPRAIAKPEGHKFSVPTPVTLCNTYSPYVATTSFNDRNWRVFDLHECKPTNWQINTQTLEEAGGMELSPNGKVLMMSGKPRTNGGLVQRFVACVNMETKKTLMQFKAPESSRENYMLLGNDHALYSSYFLGRPPPSLNSKKDSRWGR
jgi:hypothetical protein